MIEYETLVRVMAIVPTVCYPKTLEEHLMGHLPLPFYKLVSEDGESVCDDSRRIITDYDYQTGRR
jgi:hypothetical protein